MRARQGRWRSLSQRTRRTIGLTVLVVVVSGLLPLIGSSIPHSIAAGGAALTVIALWAVLGDPDRTPDESWSVPASRRRDGARRDVSELGWAILGREGRVTPRVAQRARNLAARRLAEHGVDLADPADAGAAARLLGRSVHRDIIKPGELPAPRTLQAWLVAIERLAPRPDERNPR